MLLERNNNERPLSVSEDLEKKKKEKQQSTSWITDNYNLVCIFLSKFKMIIALDKQYPDREWKTPFSSSTLCRKPPPRKFISMEGQAPVWVICFVVCHVPCQQLPWRNSKEKILTTCRNFTEVSDGLSAKLRLINLSIWCMKPLNIGTHTTKRQILTLPNIKGGNQLSRSQQW